MNTPTYLSYQAYEKACREYVEKVLSFSYQAMKEAREWIEHRARELQAQQLQQGGGISCESLAKRIPRVRLKRIEDGNYVGFELISDPEGPLCRFRDVRMSGFYADLMRDQASNLSNAGAIVVTDDLIADLLPDAIIFADFEEHLSRLRVRAKRKLTAALCAALGVER